MQLGYWGGIWGTTRPQNIMVSKMNTVSLATVEVGNPRLVVRWYWGTQALAPSTCCSAITMHLQGRSSSPLHHPCSLKEGEKKGRRWPRLSPSRERPRSHTLDFSSFPTGQNPVMQPCLTARELGNAVSGLCRCMSRCTFTYWRNERMDVEAEGQLTLSSIVCWGIWCGEWFIPVEISQPLELCCQSSKNPYCGRSGFRGPSCCRWESSLWWELA